MKTKKLLSIFLALIMVLCTVPMTVFAADGDVAINASTFPDAIFRAYVREEIDKNKDKKLSTAEIENATFIGVINQNIKSLKGIEYFTALEVLFCGNNQLTTLDVSKNTALRQLVCGYNQLTELDLSNNTELAELACRNNQLTTLDVSNNTKLTKLNCSWNQLTELDLSNNTELTGLYCYDNQLTTLDVSNNTKLEELSCWNNQLTSLDLSNNTELTSLYCYDNKYVITLDGVRTFDLATLPGNFDVTNASNWNGGTVSGAILTANKGVTEIAYTYDVGKGDPADFRLEVIQPDEPVVDVPTTEELPFTDVANDAQYYEAVAYLYAAGIMNGTGDTIFSPDYTLNRATVVTMLYRLEGCPEVEVDAAFTDVEADEWYTAAVHWAASVGIVEGYGDGTFGPKKNVTNEQLAAIIKRYAEYKGVTINETTELPADAVVSDWAVANVAWAASEGILSAEQIADAKTYADRAQVAVSVYTYIIKTAE